MILLLLFGEMTFILWKESSLSQAEEKNSLQYRTEVLQKRKKKEKGHCQYYISYKRNLFRTKNK